MLIMKFMTKVTLRLIGTIFGLVLKFAPRNFQSACYNASRPEVGQKIDGWEYREVISPETGISHRYYYHPGPSKSAPVFLFLHGLFLDGRNFINVKDLSDSRQLIAYDFPDSSPFYRGDMSDFRYLLDDFLDTLKIDSLYLCGVSFGGGIATRFAASHGRRVKALILVSTFIMNSGPFDRIKSREMARFILKHPDFKLHWLIDNLFRLSLRGAGEPTNEIKKIIRVKSIDWYRQVARSITTCEGPEDAMQIRCPVLTLQGTADRTVSLKSSYSIPRFIPHTRFEEIKGGTHAMMYLQGPFLAEKIKEFCDSISGAISESNSRTGNE